MHGEIDNSFNNYYSRNYI